MEQSSAVALVDGRAGTEEEPPEGVGTLGILARVRDVVRACSVAAGDHGVDEWMALLDEVTRAQAVLAAARDAAIVRLAAIDEVVTEDGVIGEQVNGLGTVSVDAGAMVSTATGTSARFGQELVEQAVTRVVRVPALHEAMVEGLLDDYKARRLAAELDDVPVDLARAVVAALLGELSSTSGPALQRRARAMLMRLCPDLLRKRIRRSRARVGLRRWMGEPGTDAWGGSFPSERAAVAWAAVDALARRYRLEGRFDTLEQARAYALMDLVDGSSTVETVLHLTVPAEDLDRAASADEDHVAEHRTAPTPTDGHRAPPGGVPRQPHRARGSARQTVGTSGSSAPFGVPAAPGVSDTAGAPDTAGAAGAADTPDTAGAAGAGVSDTAAAAGAAGAPAGDAFVGVAGSQGQSIAWFPVTSLPSCSGDPRSTGDVCHPGSGTLLDPGDTLGTRAYRPGETLRTLVRRRDGGCRFPGCSVSARQCDLDHVVPWPHGPTAASNLICLCRRHHRVKQRHRWRVRLRSDGVVEWLDPAGRWHHTDPVDHLGVSSPRVIDVGLRDVATGDDELAEERSTDLEELSTDPEELSTDSEELVTSAVERWLAVTVEHAVAMAAAAAASPAAKGGGAAMGRGAAMGGDAADRGRRRDRHPPIISHPAIISAEELDELSRDVRAGRFPDLDAAFEARRSEIAVRLSRRHRTDGSRECRIDARLSSRRHRVTIELESEDRPSHRECGATTPTLSLPPF